MSDQPPAVEYCRSCDHTHLVGTACWFAQPSAVGTPQPDGGCEDCGLPYKDFPLDTTLPDADWLTIHPTGYGGFLCAGCIAKRAAKVPGVTVLFAQLSRSAVWTPQPDFRQGCRCQCCDHGEGSDCACECHRSGACACHPVAVWTPPSADDQTALAPDLNRILQMSLGQFREIEKRAEVAEARAEAAEIGVSRYQDLYTALLIDLRAILDEYNTKDGDLYRFVERIAARLSREPHQD